MVFLNYRLRRRGGKKNVADDKAWCRTRKEKPLSWISMAAVFCTYAKSKKTDWFAGVVYRDRCSAWVQGAEAEESQQAVKRGAERARRVLCKLF